MNLLIIEGRKLKRSKLLWILIAAILIMWIPCVLNADVNFDMEAEGISPENNFFIQGLSLIHISWGDDFAYGKKRAV